MVKTPSPRLPGFLNYGTAWVETENVMLFFLFTENYMKMLLVTAPPAGSGRSEQTSTWMRISATIISRVIKIG